MKLHLLYHVVNNNYSPFWKIESKFFDYTWLEVNKDHDPYYINSSNGPLLRLCTTHFEYKWLKNYLVLPTIKVQSK